MPSVKRAWKETEQLEYMGLPENMSKLGTATQTSIIFHWVMVMHHSYFISLSFYKCHLGSVPRPWNHQKLPTHKMAVKVTWVQLEDAIGFKESIRVLIILPLRTVAMQIAHVV
jgi:hypothetical protein